MLPLHNGSVVGVVAKRVPVVHCNTMCRCITTAILQQFGASCTTRFKQCLKQWHRGRERNACKTGGQAVQRPVSCRCRVATIMQHCATSRQSTFTIWNVLWQGGYRPLQRGYCYNADRHNMQLAILHSRSQEHATGVRACVRVQRDVTVRGGMQRANSSITFTLTVIYLWCSSIVLLGDVAS